jgi:hypothetical protein
MDHHTERFAKAPAWSFRTPRSRSTAYTTALVPIYILTLTTTSAARVANSSTSWSLAKGDGVLASGVSADDPHGDRARVDGRAAARKHANSLGRRFALSDVKVRYTERPEPVASAAPVSPSKPIL